MQTVRTDPKTSQGIFQERAANINQKTGKIIDDIKLKITREN